MFGQKEKHAPFFVTMWNTKIPSPIKGYFGAIIKTSPVFTWGYINTEKGLYCVNGKDLSFRWSLEEKKVRPFCVIQLELLKFTTANSLVFSFFSSSTSIWIVRLSQECNALALFSGCSSYPREEIGSFTKHKWEEVRLVKQSKECIQYLSNISKGTIWNGFSTCPLGWGDERHWERRYVISDKRTD